MIPSEPFTTFCHRFLKTCITGNQNYRFIAKYFDRKADYWITEEFNGIEYYVVKGDFTWIQLQDYTFMIEESDRIKKEAATTREAILEALNVS